MIFKHQEVNQYSNDWFCKIIYEDKDGFKTIFEKNGFKSKQEAEAHLILKRQEIEK